MLNIITTVACCHILCCAVFISTYAVEVTDEDIHTPLVTYVPSY